METTKDIKMKTEYKLSAHDLEELFLNLVMLLEQHKPMTNKEEFKEIFHQVAALYPSNENLIISESFNYYQLYLNLY